VRIDVGGADWYQNEWKRESRSTRQDVRDSNRRAITRTIVAHDSVRGRVETRLDAVRLYPHAFYFFIPNSNDPPIALQINSHV